MQTRTITVDYARPRGYDVGYRAENNFTELSLPVPAELEGADSYRVYFESTVGEYLQTGLLTPVDGYVAVKITSDVVPEPGNMAAQLVAFGAGEIVGYAPMITGSAKVSIPDGTERLSPSLAAEIALNTAARHSHENKAVLDKFAETDGKPTYDGQAIGLVERQPLKTSAIPTPHCRTYRRSAAHSTSLFQTPTPTPTKIHSISSPIQMANSNITALMSDLNLPIISTLRVLIRTTHAPWLWTI